MIKYNFKVAQDYLNYIDSIFKKKNDFSEINIEKLFLKFKDFDPVFKNNLIHSFLVRLPEEKMETDYNTIFSLFDKYNFVIDTVFAAALINEKENLVNNEGIFKEIEKRKAPYYERFYLIYCENISIISIIIKSLSGENLHSMIKFINESAGRIKCRDIPELLKNESDMRLSIYEKNVLLNKNEHKKISSGSIFRL